MARSLRTRYRPRTTPPQGRATEERHDQPRETRHSGPGPRGHRRQHHERRSPRPHRRPAGRRRHRGGGQHLHLDQRPHQRQSPSALTVDRTSINKPGGNLACDGGITASLNNNPAFTFDDATATARTDLIDITGQQSFVSCRYKATNIVWDRDGTTRKYVNRAFTATKASGSFLCPASVTTAAGGASMLFH